MVSNSVVKVRKPLDERNSGRPTVYHGAEKFHVPDIIVRRPPTGSNMLKDFFAQSGIDFGIHSEAVDSDVGDYQQ